MKKCIVEIGFQGCQGECVRTQIQIHARMIIRHSIHFNVIHIEPQISPMLDFPPMGD